jgi:hypothetical protein
MVGYCGYDDGGVGSLFSLFSLCGDGDDGASGSLGAISRRWESGRGRPNGVSHRERRHIKAVLLPRRRHNNNIIIRTGRLGFDVC